MQKGEKIKFTLTHNIDKKMLFVVEGETKEWKGHRRRRRNHLLAKEGIDQMD